MQSLREKSFSVVPALIPISPTGGRRNDSFPKHTFLRLTKCRGNFSYPCGIPSMPRQKRQQACIRHEKRTCCSASPNEKQQRPNLPCGRPQSTLGADELNFCVRDGNRWSLIAIVTAMVYIRDLSRIYLSRFSLPSLSGNLTTA